MLGKTSLSALRATVLLAQQPEGTCWPPRKLAETLDESPTYMAKVVRHLVKCGVLEAEKGAKGGVRLVQPPEQITLLTITEACHGAIVGNFCKGNRPPSAQCSFHRAALELHQAITGVLVRWTVADLLERPQAKETSANEIPCLMGPGLNGGRSRSGLAQLKAKK